ncbi:MAG: S8 family serine peptidase [Planctomycetes bacterium]|nr:S8 family serine peptidase [Planctomycetota bacterium]
MKNIISAMCMMLLFGQALCVTASEDTQPVVKLSDLENTVDLFIESEVTSLRGKLVNYADIVGPLEQGAETVKVIVNLVEPPQIKTLTDSSSPNAFDELRDRIAAIQDSVFSGLRAGDFKLRYRYHNFASFSGEATPDGLAKLLNDPKVETVEPVYLEQTHLMQGINLINGNQYRSSNSVTGHSYTGAGIGIAICDTGIDYTHPDLGGGTFPNVKVVGGYDFVGADRKYPNEDADPIPGYSTISFHGTGCAGIAAGDAPDDDEDTDYIGGVACDAKLYALKVSADNSNGLSTDAVIKAWEWCVTQRHDDPNSQHPILVLSYSGGGRRYTMPGDSINTEGFEMVNRPLYTSEWSTRAPDRWENFSGDQVSGTYSFKAANVRPYASCIWGVQLKCEQGNIEFQLKVPSRYGKLDFCVDGTKIDHRVHRWEDEKDWQLFQYEVEEGIHTFWWIYHQSIRDSGSEDTAMIDDITFPITRASLAHTRAADSAVAAGITVLSSSGNDGYCDAMGSPACISNVISVGAVYDSDIGRQIFALKSPESCISFECEYGSTGWCVKDDTTEADMVTCYSNTAPFLDILAPAHNAYTTDIVGNDGVCKALFDKDYPQCDILRPDYIPFFGGTSAACPYAAGVVACLQQAAYENMGRYLMPSEVKDILIATGDLVTDPKAPDITKPRVNLGWAIDNIPGLASSAEKFYENFFWIGFDFPWILNRATTPIEGSPRDNVLKLKSGTLATLKEPIDLSSQTRAVLTYLYKRTGAGDSPSADKDLVLEYADGQRWVELDRRDSDRQDMTDYGFAITRVPDKALSSEFKMCIRCEGSTDEEQGDWFIDDIVIKIWTLVFEDSFPVTDVNEEKWPINDAIVDEHGHGKPSLPYSLHFNGRASAESKTIDLSKHSGAVLTFHYQRNDYNASKPLLIEYYSGSNWEELARLPGRARGMTEYHRDMRYLPPEALHSDFKFRIRSEDSQLTQLNALYDWFVDDITIEAW